MPIKLTLDEMFKHQEELMNPKKSNIQAQIEFNTVQNQDLSPQDRNILSYKPGDYISLLEKNEIGVVEYMGNNYLCVYLYGQPPIKVGFETVTNGGVAHTTEHKYLHHVNTSSYFSNEDKELLEKFHIEVPTKEDSTNPKDKIGIKKPQLNLVPASSRIYQALAMEDGAKKYNPFNWREKKVKASIYIAACVRHMDQWYDSREECAEDSGVPHLGHALACLGILVDAYETGNLIDDRPVAGKAVELLKKWTKKGE
jgi:hypothetical protein